MDININEYDSNILIKQGDIIAISGDKTKEILSRKLVLIDTNINEIKYDDILIDKTHLTKKNDIQNQIGYVFNNPKEYLTNKTCYQELLYNLRFLNITNKKKLIDEIFSTLNLDLNLLKKKSLEISLRDQKMIMIASILIIKPKVIMLNNIEIGLLEKDKILIKRVLKEINFKNKTTIIIFSNNQSFYYDLAKNYLVLEKNKVIINEEISKCLTNTNSFINLAPLIEFLEIAGENKIKLGFVTSANDLLKNIYRSINNQL